MQEVRDLEIKISFLRTIITASSNNVHDICGYEYDASTCPFQADGAVSSQPFLK
jgi:hypothetical protein